VSVPYRQILRIAAQRVSAITGVTAAALEAAYLASPLTVTEIGNTDFTLAMIRDNLVSVIGRVVRAYSSVPNHPFRAFNLSQTTNIAHKGVIPSVNSAAKPIVGVYGAIRNVLTGEPMTKQPAQIIKTIVGNTNGRLKGTYDYYDIVGERLYHTAANAVIDVCTFDANDELTAIGANGNAPIPDSCLDLAWTGLVASLMIDDEYSGQAQIHGQYFESAIEAMRSGATNFAPAPQLLANAAPVVS
jgi:hypothetical protein